MAIRHGAMGMGQWAWGMGHRPSKLRSKFGFIPNYPLPITHYPLPIPIVATAPAHRIAITFR
ncbi:hypothetical protein NIES4075_44770 [Tolypothrix sp. NIES-4075]|nr:hypothetical protein NIES4075_44770 [Tolypothrix sp. NIES-4075]